MLLFTRAGHYCRFQGLYCHSNKWNRHHKHASQHSQLSTSTLSFPMHFISVIYKQWTQKCPLFLGFCKVFPSCPTSPHTSIIIEPHVILCWREGAHFLHWAPDGLSWPGLCCSQNATPDWFLHLWPLGLLSWGGLSSRASPATLLSRGVPTGAMKVIHPGGHRPHSMGECSPKFQNIVPVYESLGSRLGQFVGSAEPELGPLR